MSHDQEKEMHNIVGRIRGRREELGYSFQDLANLTGISKSTLQRYETGYIKNLPLSKIEILAKALKTTGPYLMGWEENKKNNEAFSSDIDKDILAVVDLMIHTDSETRRYIYTLVRDYLRCSVRDQSRINSVAYMIAERTLADKVKPLKKSEDIIKDIIDIDLAK